MRFADESYNLREEAVRKRAGRWIERYPDFEARLGTAFTLEDLVEEVFLNAFEHFEQRPDELRLGEWLEGLIDDPPCVDESFRLIPYHARS